MFLQDYNLVWTHLPGTAMGPADALSCKDEVDTSLNNTEQILLPHLHINMLDAALASKIVESTPSDQFIIDTLAAMEASTVPLSRSSPHDWYFADGALYYKSCLYIPEPAHHPLVVGIHKSLAGTHSGYFRTISLPQKDYWWPRMTTFVHKFITRCATCQANKVNTHPAHPPLAPISSHCTHPFQQISMDLITDLPLSCGYDSVLVMVDHGLSKGVIFCPCNKTTSAVDIAEIFFQHVFPQFSLHDQVISNRGPQFASAFARELACLLDYNIALSAAYHPQTDRESKRVNQELKTFLRIFTKDQPSKWSELLPMAEFTHNSATHSVTNATPFFLMMGYEPQAYPKIGQTFLPELEKRLHLLSKAQKEAIAAHEKAALLMKDQIHSHFTPWKVGDKVWLDNKNLNLHYESRKLAPKREGPFEIEQVLSPSTYKLCLPPTWKMHPVFHASLLSTYQETEEHGPNFLSPPPSTIHGEEEYTMESIIAHRVSASR